jgi:Replication factor C C-terminal domain
MKSQICLHISNTEKRLIDGADEYLQLLSIFMCIKSAVINVESIYSK